MGPTSAKTDRGEAATGKSVSHLRGSGGPRTCEKLWATITRWTRGQRASLVGVGLHQLHLGQPQLPLSPVLLGGDKENTPYPHLRVALSGSAQPYERNILCEPQGQPMHEVQGPRE